MPVGHGVVFLKGEKVLNPWIKKMNQLNISSSRVDLPSVYDKYNEFMTDHFGFLQPCTYPAILRSEDGGGYKYNYVGAWLYPYLSVSAVAIFFVLLWIAPTRHVFNHIAASCHF